MSSIQPVVTAVSTAEVTAGILPVLTSILPATVHEFNTVRLPALEIAWGRSFKEEWATEDPKHRTQEITKVYTRILNNVLYKMLASKFPTFKEYGTVGSDFTIDSVPFEDKNSFSTSDTWTGNGYKKTDWHLLKKFSLDENGRIASAFACLVNLSSCKSTWTAPTLSSNFSSLHLLGEDMDKIHIICGSLVPKKKYLSVSLQRIEGIQN